MDNNNSQPAEQEIPMPIEHCDSCQEPLEPSQIGLCDACQEAASLLKPPIEPDRNHLIRAIIIVQGGCVSSISCDSPDVKFALLDCDTEGAAAEEDDLLFELSDGSIVQAATYDAERFMDLGGLEENLDRSTLAAFQCQHLALNLIAADPSDGYGHGKDGTEPAEHDLKLTDQEHAYVVAALRFYAADLDGCSRGIEPGITAIATNFGKHTAPTSEDVDAIADKLLGNN